MNIANKEFPRVLIVSHNCLSDSQDGNGKTMSAFFRNWNIENLAQVYLTTDIPEFTVCKKFFQLNDLDILKRFFLNKSIQGRQIEEKSLQKMQIYKENIRSNPFLKLIRVRMFPVYRLFRDLMWAIAGYKTDSLRAFIDDFNPQIVFFQSSNNVFAFMLVKWICKTKNIPLIMQTTDDYVSAKMTLDPFFWIQLFRLKRAYQWAVTYSDVVIAIGDKMVDEYKTKFGGHYCVAMNSVLISELPPPSTPSNVIKFLYSGSTGLNRWKVLGIISQSLKELNQEEGLEGALSIYSLVRPSPRIISYLNNPPFCSFNGSLNNDQLKDVRLESDFLVHVEAFDKINRHITRLSISTKIPEYMASGRCIFAVGPDDVASIQYLQEFDLAVVVTSDKKDVIKNALREIMKNMESANQYIENAVRVAKLRHNQTLTAENIFELILKAISNRFHKP